MSAKQKYGYAFLDHGFVNMPSQGIDWPQCVICHKVLMNESLKKSKLVDHLTSRHPLLKEKDRQYFEGKAKQLCDIQFGSTSSTSTWQLQLLWKRISFCARVWRQPQNEKISSTLWAHSWLNTDWSGRTCIKYLLMVAPLWWAETSGSKAF